MKEELKAYLLGVFCGCCLGIAIFVGLNAEGII